MLPLHRLRLETMYTVSRKCDVVCDMGQGQFEFKLFNKCFFLLIIAALIIGSFIVSGL